LKKSTVAFTLALVACSSSSSPPTTVPDGGTPPTTVPDGGTCSFDVYRHDPNSWLLTVPEMHFDFWGSYWTNGNNTDALVFQTDWSYLLDSGNVLERLSEYGIHEGTLDPVNHYNTGSTTYVGDAGEFVHNEDGGSVSILDDNTFVATINSEIQGGTLPYPTDNTVYVVMLPPNVNSQLMVNSNFIGYHRNGSYGEQRYAYAIILYTGVVDNNKVIMHELAEAATDPLLGTGFTGANNEQEVGDLCEAYFDTIGGIEVQSLWSQALCQCR